MEGSDMSVDNVVAEDAKVASPTEEAADVPSCEGEGPAQEPLPAEEDAADKARVNGADTNDASENELAEAPESDVVATAVPEDNAKAEESDSPRGVKRRASRTLSGDSDEFLGFTADEGKLDDSAHHYSTLLDKMDAEVAADEATLVPVRRVAVPAKLKRSRTDDGSRSSSSMSHRSDGDTFSSDIGAGSPAGGRGRRTATDSMSSPLFRVPLERGWKRELVYRAATLDAHSRRNADIYYYSPTGKKLRSSREVSEHIAGSGLTLDNFTFFKEPLGIDDPDKEIIRDAKARDSPQSSPAPAAAPVEGKRTPKPKAPKGASPEPKTVQQLKLKVKSQGSRLSGSRSSGDKTPTTQSTNSNTSTPSSSWKRPSTPSTPNGDAGGKKRGRPSGRTASGADQFTPFYQRGEASGYQVVQQIFQYLGMRDLARCARVCRLWRQFAATPALWRHVRMKNSQVNNWRGLCAALARNGTKRLDLRKMLLPQNDSRFWQQFAENIATVESLERLELCKCPASAVEAVCRGLSGLRQLGALAVRDARLDPAPLARLTNLHDLRIKSLCGNGLTLTSDLMPLAGLTNLQHLSLTSIKELNGAMCGVVVGSLHGLVSLELGECTFGAEFGAVLSKLAALQRLRLERGTTDCDVPALLRALSTLPALKQLELVNFDVKPGFDEALGQCRNIQRLLIIPTYVSQSATTNRQVLSGVLRLKDTLTHLMWGVTIELLRVTELFIDQCEGGAKKSKMDGQSIPVLKPVPGYSALSDTQRHTGPPQVEILPLPTLQALLSSSLPNTKLKLLKIPFHSTWRQSLADFQ